MAEIKTNVEVQLGRGNHGFVLTIKDGKSQTFISRMFLSAEQMGRMLGSEPVVVDDSTVWTSENIGKQYYCKCAYIPINDTHGEYAWEKEMDRVEAQLEIDEPEWQLIREKYNHYSTKRDRDVRYYKFMLRKWDDS